MGRPGRPTDIADALALPVSDDARRVTVQDVRVTGGMLRVATARA